jgi:hypothetical protein
MAEEQIGKSKGTVFSRKRKAPKVMPCKVIAIFDADKEAASAAGLALTDPEPERKGCPTGIADSVIDAQDVEVKPREGSRV